MTEDIIRSTLFQSRSYIGASNISVYTNKNGLVFVALHCDERRQGGLPASLAADGWKLKDGWYIELDNVLTWHLSKPAIRPRYNEPEIMKCKTLDKVWSRKIDAGQTISFTTKQDYMTLTFALFIKEGNIKRQHCSM